MTMARSRLPIPTAHREQCSLIVWGRICAWTDLSLYASMGSFFKPNNTVYTDNYIYLDKNGNRYFPEEGRGVRPGEGWQFEIGLKYDWNGLSTPTVLILHP